MKLRNKKTGGLANLIVDKDLLRVKTDAGWQDYTSLKDLLKEWEDYQEESKDIYWCMDECGFVEECKEEWLPIDRFREEIGNYFETKEKAEKAVERLKAWKRLKDKGFRFDGWDENHHNLGIIEFSFDRVENNVWGFENDLNLLFGGEE